MERALRIGLYSPFFGSTFGGGEKFLGVTAQVLRDAFPRHRVDLIGPVAADRQLYERVLGLDLTDIRLVTTDKRLTDRYIKAVTSNGRNSAGVLLNGLRVARFSRRYDLFFTVAYVIPMFSRARNTIVICQFPYQVAPTKWGWRWVPPPINGNTFRAYRNLRQHFIGDIETRFDTVLCYSNYVRDWVIKYWQRDGTVVSPPVDVPDYEPDWEGKRKAILSVGRFFTGGHDKRHDVMARAFIDLCESGTSGWELHLAGSVPAGDGDARAYFERVQEMSQGYPVRLHANPSFTELETLYREASIYWHAAGWGIDLVNQPTDAEHFGITTVEAMAHGAVPLAFAAGGQPELIDAGVNGYLWRDVDELLRQTRQLIADREECRKLGAAARAASHRYSRSEFKRHILEITEPPIRALEGR